MARGGTGKGRQSGSPKRTGIGREIQNVNFRHLLSVKIHSKKNKMFCELQLSYFETSGLTRQMKIRPWA